MRKEYKDQVADKIAARYIGLEEWILQDIARRIKKTGEITSTADWQINRLRILGYSSEDIEREIKKTLDASYPEMFELYDKVIDWEYVRNNRSMQSLSRMRRTGSCSRSRMRSFSRAWKIWRM